MEVLSARKAAPGGARGKAPLGEQYVLQTARGEYLYTARDIAAIERMFPHPSEVAVPRAYKRFHAWLASPAGPAPNARIIWNGEGQPMVDLDSGEARSEVRPLAADAAATASLPSEYDKKWHVDARRPGASRRGAPLCPACGKPARRKAK